MSSHEKSGGPRALTLFRWIESKYSWRFFGTRSLRVATLAFAALSLFIGFADGASKSLAPQSLPTVSNDGRTCLSVNDFNADPTGPGIQHRLLSRRFRVRTSKMEFRSAFRPGRIRSTVT
jgi:hypothetical protein